MCVCGGDLSLGWGFPEYCQVCDERAWFSEMKETLERIQIQPLQVSDMAPEFQGGKRSSSRSYSELVVGMGRKSMPSDPHVGLCPPHHVVSLPSIWKMLHSELSFSPWSCIFPRDRRRSMLFNVLCGFSLGVKFSFCPSVGCVKYCMVESCFLPEGQEK